MSIYKTHSVAKAKREMAAMKTKHQPMQQTYKANATPRMGQKKRSPLQRFLGQSKKYGIDSASYNVGRTRRMA